MTGIWVTDTYITISRAGLSELATSLLLTDAIPAGARGLWCRSTVCTANILVGLTYTVVVARGLTDRVTDGLAPTHIAGAARAGHAD